MSARPQIAWLAMGGALFIGRYYVPVTIRQLGPKRATVDLRVKAKLPNKHGGVWRDTGHRTHVPRDSLRFWLRKGDRVLDGRGCIKETKRHV